MHEFATALTRQVSHCVPALTNLQELLDELNRTNDLSKFMRAMRNAFRTSMAP